eukprot:scaffold66040_cov60-Phaeocystis_antarctica.AAC.1
MALPLGGDVGELRRDSGHVGHGRAALARDEREEGPLAPGERRERVAKVLRGEGRRRRDVDGNDGRATEAARHHVRGQVVDVAAVHEEVHNVVAVLIARGVADGRQVASERHGGADVAPHRAVAVDEAGRGGQVGRDAEKGRRRVL